ncbi:MAG: NACHT domain-containing protein, partial [Snowella sp.]
LQIFQNELKNADYQEGQIKQYFEPIQKFIEQPKVATILGNAFEVNCKSLDTSFLAKTWQEMNLPFLPEDFDWELIGKLYIRRVKKIITNSEKLRPIYEVQLQAKQTEGIQELVGIVPDFDLGRYAEGLREQYGNLKLESLDTTGVYYNELKLWKIFIPQNVRECQEFLPQVYEVPKDHIKRLREAGEAIEILSAEELERQRHRYVNQQSRLVWEIIGDPTAKPAKSSIQQVVILGDPGSGKSSLLQYIALIWAERPLRDLSLYPLPLLLELRIYARDKQAGKCQDILSFIHGGNITCRLNQQQLHEKLRSGQAVALFDGIDEIFDPVLREEVVTDIHRFSNDYAQVQVIVTSRWLGYKAQRLREAGEAIEILSEEELERQRHRYVNQQSQLVWEVIGNPTAKPAKSPIQQVVILGDPGAGKSSLLQYIALIWAELPLRDLSLYPLPLLLELRLYARDKQAGKCRDILSFIHGGNITCRLNQQELHEKLESGQALA